MKIDVKKFKRVSSDDKSTTLRHADGHEIKIAHKNLSEKMKNELVQNFADGGEVEEEARSNSAKKLSISSDQLSAMDAIPVPEAQRDIASTEPEANAETGRQLPSWLTKPGSELISDAFKNSANSLPPGYTPEMLAKENAMKEAEKGPALTPPPAAAPAELQSPASLAPPQATTLQQPPMSGLGGSDPYGTEAYQNTFMKGVNQQQAGIMQGAAAEGALGNQQAEIAHNQQAELMKAQQNYEVEHKRLSDEFNNVIADVKTQHINPNHFQESMSSGQKVRSAIGMILSGFGSGLSGQENMAMKFLNQQIDRDIEAQKSNLGKSETLLNANLKQFGNLNDATNMTRAMQMGITASQLQEAAGKSADPIAKARALTAAGQLQQQAAPILSQIAMKKTMMNAMQGGENPDKVLQIMRVVDPAKAKEMESRYVPNVGFASVPVPESVRKELVGRNELQHGLETLMKFAKQHEGTVMDPAVKNQGHTLAKQVQDSYRRANGQGVFREGEAAFVNSIIDEDPTKFFAKFRTLPKYQTALAMNRNALNSTLQGYGLQPVKDLSALEQKPKFK